ncbi:MAG: calcium/sodium antiporter [Planctomycetota bacterium]|nr:calcium/sodium antiporter [Planctomycetota bacterium]
MEAGELALYITAMLASTVLLWKGADWLVEAATKIARVWGVSDLVIGLTVVSFGTSAPEFAVTVFGAMQGHSNIPVGNVVGSNVFNLGFILGTCAALVGLKTTSVIVYRDGIFLIFVTCLLRFFLQDQALDPWEGVVLFSMLVAYNVFLFTRKEIDLDDDEMAEGVADKSDYVWLLIGIIAVVAGGELMLYGAKGIAKGFGISDWPIAVTFVAAATSLPELATSMMAIYRGQHGLSVGNLIGSDLFNLLGVLGVAGMLGPLYPDTAALHSTTLLIVMVCVVVLFMRSGWKVGKFEGTVLVVGNLIRWVFDFMGSGSGPAS